VLHIVGQLLIQILNILYRVVTTVLYAVSTKSAKSKKVQSFKLSERDAPKMSCFACNSNDNCEGGFWHVARAGS